MIPAQRAGLWTGASKGGHSPAPRGGWARHVVPVRSLSVKSEPLLPLVLFLLPFYILPYHLLVQPHRPHAISLRPKVIAPVAVPPQIPKHAQHPDRTLALQPPHVFRDRQLRRNL